MITLGSWFSKVGILIHPLISLPLPLVQHVHASSDELPPTLQTESEQKYWVGTPSEDGADRATNHNMTLGSQFPASNNFSFAKEISLSASTTSAQELPFELTS